MGEAMGVVSGWAWAWGSLPYGYIYYMRQTGKVKPNRVTFPVESTDVYSYTSGGLSLRCGAGGMYPQHRIGPKHIYV